MVEKALAFIAGDIRNKDVLEIGCGSAAFSLAAKALAKSVACLDLDAFRLSPAFASSGIPFYRQDAGHTDFQDSAFDVVIGYNAAGHLERALDEVTAESLRLLRPGGQFILLSSFKMDRHAIMIRAPGIAGACGLEHQVSERPFLCVKIRKRV